jgi:nitronate monooxygenase
LTDRSVNDRVSDMRTAITELLGVEHPIVQAPMGGSAGGALAAAVSTAGGFGMVGHGDREWLTRELRTVTAATDAPWGVGFLAWAANVPDVEYALSFGPTAVMLSFGDPTPLVPAVREAGALLIIQAVDVDEVEQARAIGADVVVAQGTEAGGHGAAQGRSTLSFVPLVVDLLPGTPVLAAGGIHDGRGIAAMHALGAAGVLVGSRFQATSEAIVDRSALAAAVGSHGFRTERSSVSDILRGSAWPRRYTARTVVDRFVDEWRGREDLLVDNPGAADEYRAAIDAAEIPPLPVWTNESVDPLNDVRPAELVMRELIASASAALAALEQADLRSPPGPC